MKRGPENIWPAKLMPGERLLWDGRAANASLIAGLAAVLFITILLQPLASPPAAAILFWAVRLRRERYALTDRRVLALRAPLFGATELRELNREGTTLMPGHATSNKSLTFTSADGHSIRFSSQPLDVRRWFIENYARAGAAPIPTSDQIA